MKKFIFVNFLAICAMTVNAQTTQTKTAPETQAPARPPSTPQTTGAQASEDYVIGAEDVLGVVVWRNTEMTGDVTVRPDGKITLPLVGDLQAAGLKPGGLAEIITKAAAKFYEGVNVTVVVRQINSKKAFITGEVRTPGPYPLTGPRTVMQLIALAGGFTEFADSKNITIMRAENGQTRIFKFNYRDVSQGKNVSQNILLNPGDTVVVP
jgi:polysaccharide export outer membrane protein